MYDNILVLKRSDIPDVASIRLDPEDKEMVWKLIQILNPKKLTTVFREGLKALLEKQDKQ